MLISMLGALIVIIAYCLGVWTGSHFYCPRVKASEAEATESKVPEFGKGFMRKETMAGDNCLNRPARKEAEGSQLSDSSVGDAERQRQFEEDLKAFEACMNYSAERAYDMLKGFSAE